MHESFYRDDVDPVRWEDAFRRHLGHEPALHPDPKRGSEHYQVAVCLACGATSDEEEPDYCPSAKCVVCGEMIGVRASDPAACPRHPVLPPAPPLCDPSTLRDIDA